MKKLGVLFLALVLVVCLSFVFAGSSSEEAAQSGAIDASDQASASKPACTPSTAVKTDSSACPFANAQASCAEKTAADQNLKPKTCGSVKNISAKKKSSCCPTSSSGSNQVATGSPADQL